MCGGGDDCGDVGWGGWGWGGYLVQCRVWAPLNEKLVALHGVGPELWGCCGVVELMLKKIGFIMFGVILPQKSTEGTTK